MSLLKTTLLYLLLSCVIGFGVFLAYQPHIDNPFPLIADEYVHISFAKQLLEEGILPFSNPYIATPTLHMNYESGFHFFLALLLAIVPGEAVLVYKYFATAFFVVNGLLLFYLVRAWSKQYVAALFAVLFFGTITSADGLLAHQYFVPLTLGTTLLLLLHILFYHFLTTHQHRYLGLTAGTLVITAITYPPTLFFFLFTVGVYLFSMRHNLAAYLHVTKRTFFTLLSAISLFGVSLFLAILTYLQLLDEITFHTSWSSPYDEYSLLFFFGVVPSILALIGIWHTTRHANTISRMILFWFFYSLIALYAFYLFEYSLLVPFPRLFFFFLISMSVLAGYGANAIISFALSRKAYIYRILLLVLLCVAVGYHVTQVAQTSVQLPTIMTTERYQTLIQFREQYPNRAAMLADPLSSVAIYPVTGNKVLNLLYSNIGGGDSIAVRSFLQAPCAEKPGLFSSFQPYLQRADIKNAPFYILSTRTQDCAFLSKLPESSPNAYLYALREGTLDEFQLQANLEKIPNPNTANIVRPANAVDTTADLIDLMAGNTLVGDTWTEYYQPDGYIKGNTNGRDYDGVWDITDGLYCYYYPSTDESICLSVVQNANQLEFYELNGDYRSRATLKEGDHGNT